MANQEQLERLKQGWEIWNTWRDENPDIPLNLSGANLEGSNLNMADLKEANLEEANLNSARLSEARLERANLCRATLERANLRYSDLRRTNLSGANLCRTDLNGAHLNGANLSGARIGYTTLANLDLRDTKGLVTVIHEGPSPVALYEIQLPQDGSALHFLRGAGVPDEWIADYHAHMMHPIRYHSLFVSYSSKDETLARRLHADLQVSGVRCWFAPEDMKIGDKIRPRIDEAIHLQDKLLLLSEHSIASTWVENEVEAAMEKEDQQQREVLFPIRLDDVVMQTSRAWAATLRRTRHIGDFTKWTKPQAYQRAFNRLLRDLKKADELQDQETKP